MKLKTTNAENAWPTTLDRERNRVVMKITCDCGAVDTLGGGSSRRLPLDAATKKFGQHGWTVTGVGTGTCPQCQKPKRPTLSLVKPASQEEPVAALSPKQAAQEIVKAAAAEPPKAMGLDEMLLVLDTVESNYDPKTGYKDGYSDAVVAAELTCPVDWVRQVRTKKFGNLPETPEVTEIRREIASVQHDISVTKGSIKQAKNEFAREVSLLGEKFDQRMATIGKVLANLDERAVKLADRLEALTRG